MEQSIGDRDVYSEAKAEEKTARESREKKHDIRIADVGTPLWDVLNELTLVPQNYRAASTFIPYSALLFVWINEMDRIIMGTRKFTNLNVDWNPIYSRIYIATCFYLQVMRCMVVAKLATPDIHELVEMVDNEIGWDKLTLPGPIFQYFQSICVSESDLIAYGLISPTLPPIPHANDANAHSIQEDFRIYLPNLVGLRRAAQNICRQGNDNDTATLAWDHSLADSQHDRNRPVAAAHDAANQQDRDKFITPGTAIALPFSSKLSHQWRKDRTPLFIPDVAPDAGELDWATYLGFNFRIHWFMELASMIANYGRHFKGTKSMKDLALLNGKSILVKTIDEEVFANRNDQRNDRNVIGYRVRAFAAEPAIREPDFMLGMSTCINFTCAHNRGPADPRAVNNDVHRSVHYGSYWLQNDLFRSLPYDPTIAIPIVVQKNHIPNPR